MDSKSFDIEGIRIEISVHTCTAGYLREVHEVFSNYEGIDFRNILALPTFQKARIDLVSFGCDVEAEKNCLLERVWFLRCGVLYSVVCKLRWCIRPRVFIKVI